MTGPAFASVGFGLASAASWGAGDFSGGLASRRAHVLGVVVVSQAVGLGILLALAIVQSQPLPPLVKLAWGSAAGLSGAVGLVALYRALAIGVMGAVAPVTAVLAAALPVLFGALSEGLPSMVKLAGFGLALAGVWTLSRPEGPAGRPEGLGLALLAGLGFGGFFILIDQARDVALVWPLVSARATSSILTLSIALAGRRRAWLPPRGLLPLVLLAGILDVGGNAFFVLAAQAGRLDVSAVLASLYPAATVVLARVVLKERVTRARALGITAALVAIPLIAA